MRTLTRPTGPDHGIVRIFSAQIAAQGGVVRRTSTRLHPEVGLDRLTDKVRARGGHVLRSGDRFVIFGNGGALQVVGGPQAVVRRSAAIFRRKIALALRNHEGRG